MDLETFEMIEYEIEAKYGFGCGYWRVCFERACPCNLTQVGFDENIYERMRKSLSEI